ncbi:hypothetical protein BC829DRAFT_404141 [Chytridium lagenaria]|nr:hypothetical protein BC829DRAFT_404141 [Chytridium lagenaria]
MVYIKELQTTTTNILKSMQHVVSGIKAIPLVEGDLHISLSRTLFLKEFQLDRFLELLKTQLSKSKQFGFSFSKLSKYENDEKTRSFLALDVGEGHQVLACRYGQEGR